jgi:hemolysin III
MNQRVQTRAEEVANSVSHGVALVAAIAYSPTLIFSASGQGLSRLVGVAVFCVTMILLYLTSTLYHALPTGDAKRFLLKLDHGAIFMFIAGSYTPFSLGVLHGLRGWTLFVLVWSIAGVGIVLKSTDRLTLPWLSTGMYLTMGWLAIIAVVPALQDMAQAGTQWLVAGGLAYSLGVIFFVLDHRIPYSHAVWHGFVVAGSSCHTIAVIGYSN